MVKEHYIDVPGILVVFLITFFFQDLLSYHMAFIFMYEIVALM